MNSNIENVRTYQKILASNKLNLDQFDTILIDEYTMMTRNEFNQLKIKFLNLKTVYLFGDPFQLPNIKEELIDTSKFKIIELKENHRVKDPKFRKNLDRLRVCGDYSFIKQKCSVKDAILNNKMILSATHSEIARINQIGLDLNPNPLIGIYKVDCPIVFKKDIKKNGIFNNDSGIIIKIENDTLYILVNGTIETFNNDVDIQIAYSSTYHVSQGRTITDDIVLNLNDMDKFKATIKQKMIYVGITRAQNQNQLYILSP